MKKWVCFKIWNQNFCQSPLFLSLQLESLPELSFSKQKRPAPKTRQSWDQKCHCDDRRRHGDALHKSLPFHENNGDTPNNPKLTEFDRNLTGMMMTHPDDPDYNITDSAAAGTALATGVKTYNNAIGVDKNGKKWNLYLKRPNSKASQQACRHVWN